jgi:uncharacterized protein (TIGR04222 family)
MFPLNLPGPQFLVFYAVLGVIMLTLLYVLRASSEGGHVPRLDTSDPYLIAYLRGSTNEALRVATVSLIDRGLLKGDQAALVVARPDGADIARRPIERALLRAFATPAEPKAIFENRTLAAACDDYAATLKRLRLLPDDEVMWARLRRLVVFGGILVGVAVAKIVVALSAGRTNVLFLVALAGLFTVAAVVIGNPRRTVLGATALSDLRRLFSRLRARARSISPGGATAEAALLAAVFGIAALPAPNFSYARQLYPKTSPVSGCGSSCGSSCGGGGCGGGCGGCGSGD